ncbi:MAG TPA: ABC transporter ATP-binding protein/permease [Geminicoccaceae bacterium]|jgi:putative ATP-binding cassette transporter|nr:ABC transporter ATP-binding protein/permease [Geminicoccaceae bacterium]
MDVRVEPRRSRAPADRKPPPDDGKPLAAEDSVVAQLGPLFSALAASTHRRRLGLLAAGMFVVICANSVGQIRLNAWQGSFFDALEQRDLATFGAQLLVFGVIVSALLVLVVAQTWLREMLQVRLREWLTHDLLDRWLAPQRAYLLAQAGEIGVNPDQRMHEDTRHLTALSTELAVGLLQGSLLLISFIGVLWVLSSQVVFAVGDRSFSVPGYMVWCALAYAFVGSWLAWRVGRPLIPLNATRYAREAELRFALVRVSECAEGIALHGGEPDERRILDGTVSRVVTVMQGLAGRLARLTWVTSGHGWLGIVTPILVAAPGYFGGGLSFGGLMMVIGAFNQVQQSLRWFVEHFHQIADWRATLLRVMALREALSTTDTPGHEPDGIKLVDHAAGQFGFDNLSIALGGGRATLDQARIEITAGERVLILGETASDKSKLFRAMAGLWPWGSGTIHLPPRQSMMFMPQRPYLPLGSLHAAVSYPADPDRFDRAAVGVALERVGLDHLVPLLDRAERWDKDLSLDEQQRLAFARLLLHEPRWILLEDATGALEEDDRRLVMSIFEHELAHAAVISISRSAEKSFYTRILEFRRWPDGVVPVRLHPRPRSARPAEIAAA